MRRNWPLGSVNAPTCHAVRGLPSTAFSGWSSGALATALP